MGDWAGVLDTRREALKMHEELVASNPQERGDRRALALALARMGSIEMHEGNLDSALGRYRRALEIEAKLLAEDPGNVQYQLSYAWAQNNLGGALAKANRLPEAMEEFRRAIQSFTAVVSTDDQDVRGRTLLQTARVNASKSLTRLGRASEGLRMALLALEDRERLSRANVANAGALGEVAEAHFAVGLAQAGLGQNKSAAASYVAAYRILRILQNEGRENFAMREVMAEIAAALARVGGSVPEGLTPDSSSGSPTPKTTQ
jgi:tetratricopeptide (TPR) repeat protein